MADIELLIKIPEYRYNRCRANLDTLDMYEALADAVRKGKVLPKGHGRLIDVNKLHNCECKGNFSECDTCLDDDLCNLVNDAPTIIEADTESRC